MEDILLCSTSKKSLLHLPSMTIDLLHITKVLERLLLAHLRPQVSTSLDPLQFAYHPAVGVDNTTIYLLQQ